MIIDIHTHTPSHRDVVPPDEVSWNHVWRPDRAVNPAQTWENHRADQIDAQVEASVVFNIATRSAEDTMLPGDPLQVNDATADFVRDAPGRRIGFMSVLPQDPGAIDEIERCVSDLGLRGIKLGPNYQNFDPLGGDAERVYAEAERRGLPILFHQGASPVRSAPLRFAHPLAIDEVAIRHPELRIVMAHMGHPWQADTIVVIRKHPHVWADVSALHYRPWSYYQCMRLATEWNVLDKLLLGSDWPIVTPKETIDGLRNINAPIAGTALPEVPLDGVEEIIHRDSLTLLGLSPAMGDAADAGARAGR
jgi:hypothetical protein